MVSPKARSGRCWPMQPPKDIARSRTAHQPFHGYYFHMLKGQGSNAPGGAKDYVIRGKMVGGFAFVAYPAEYGNSGVMTFMMNQDGVLLQKDLGKTTTETASAMTVFDPDASWTVVQEPVTRCPINRSASAQGRLFPLFAERGEPMNTQLTHGSKRQHSRSRYDRRRCALAFRLAVPCAKSGTTAEACRNQRGFRGQ